jgi:dihydroorotate dehydrogenase (fumarate)
MTDLGTTYLGLNLKNPLVASASTLSVDLDNIRKMEDAGAGAIVMHSLFEEQITANENRRDRFIGCDFDRFEPPSASVADLSGIYLSDITSYNQGPDAYLEHLHQAKKAVRIPIIASLNGVSRGNWTQYAAKMQEAGADALELNTYYLPASANVTSGEVEQMYCDLVKQVRSRIQIPIAVKLNPYFSALANMAQRLNRAGADGLVLFNRFYQPDFDLERLEVVPNLALSNSDELLLRLHWVSILFGHTKADLAVTGGVHTALDVLKAVTAGARVAMMTSALLKNGVEHFARILTELSQWMEKHKCESIRELRGTMAMRSIADTPAFERANYIRVLSSNSLRKSSKEPVE